MSNDEHETPKRDSKGRWQKGVSANPIGRVKGSVHVPKSKNLRDAILDAAEQRGREIDPTSGVGDGIASYLKWLSEREPRSFAGLMGKLLPLTPTKVALPKIEKPEDLIAASSAIADAVASGDLAPTEGSALASIVQGVGRSMEINQLATRLNVLEQKLSQK